MPEIQCPLTCILTPPHKMLTNLKSGFLEPKDFYPNQSQGLYI